MKEEKTTIYEKTKNLIRHFGRSAAITWEASPFLFIIRIIYELVTVVLPIVSLYISREIINTISSSHYAGQREDFLKLIGYTVLIAVFNALVGRIMGYFKGIHNDLINQKITLEIINKVNELDISYFDNPKFYDDMQNALRDSGYIQGLTWVVISLIKSIVQVITNVGIMFGLNWRLSLLIIFMALPSVITDKYVAKRKYQWQLKRARNDRKLGYYKSILQSKKTAKDIRLFGVQGYFKEKYIEMWGEWFEDKKKLDRIKVTLTFFAALFPLYATTTVLIFAGNGIFNGTLTIGDYSLYSGAASQLYNSFISLTGIINQNYESEMRLSKYAEFLKCEPLVKDTGTRTIKTIDIIEFRNVSFTYPQTERKVLNNINFKLGRNTSLALVGFNGAGKSTIVKLLLRLYDPDEGEILINGVNLKEYSIQSYYKCIGVVFQDFCRYALKMRETVALTDIDSVNDDERIITACHEADVDMNVLKPDEGIDTYLGKVFDEDGAELSGGNWQKIAIAQAYFKKASMMVFDEPNAALDPDAERKLFEKMKDLSKDKCVIYVTHRLSSATTADQILVINNGECCEIGNHRELMASRGLYYDLFNKQAEFYKN